MRILEKQSGSCSKVKHRVIIQSSNSTPRYIPKSNENLCPHKSLYTNNIIYNSPKGRSNPSMDEWINKMWYYGWMDKQNAGYPCNGIYSAIKRDEVLVHATIWTNLENIMVSVRS